MDRRILPIGCALILLAAATTVRAGEIHRAIRDTDQARVEELLRKDPSLLNAVDEGTTTRDLPIHTAAITGSVEIARMLLDAGAKLESEDADGSTPLHDAALVRKTEMVRFLLERGADVNRRDRNGAYSLSFAASGGDSAIVRMLLDRGADPYYVNLQGLSLMHLACSRGLWWLMDTLLASGADINQLSTQGMTPLHLAAMGPNPEAVRATLQHGARVDPIGTHGDTPLHMTCWNNRLESARILLEQGANPNAADSMGLTPLILASRFDGTDLVRLLLEKGATAAVQDSFGRTPLQGAVENGNSEIVALLLKAGAGLQCRDGSGLGNSLLHFAAAYGYADVARDLLAAGADPDTVNEDGQTPLALAERYGNRKVLDVLAGSERPAGTASASTASAKASTYRTARLEALPKLGNGDARVWYTGQSGWAVKTRRHLLLFDAGVDPAGAGQQSDDPGLCNGGIDPAEIAGENVIFFASHSHADHFHRWIFDLKDKLPHVQYVLGFRPAGLEGYEFIAPHETKTVDGVRIHAIESTDTGVGFFVEADGITIYHAGDHANRFRDMSGPFKGEIDGLLARGVKTDLAFLPVSGCNFGDQVAVKIGNDYILDRMKPKVFFPMHGGRMGKVYRDYVAECRDRFPNVQMLAAVCKGDQFQFLKGRGDTAAR